MLQFPKHGNKENLERNSRLRIASGPVFTRHLNATTTMAVRSVTSSPGASRERRFKGRGTRDEGRGTWGEGRRIITVHSPCFSHYARRDEGRGTRNEEKRAARNNHCSLTLFLTLTLRKECEERGTNSYSLFTVHYKGIFPCFFLGNFTALVSSIRKALISFERVWSGRITSST